MLTRIGGSLTRSPWQLNRQVDISMFQNLLERHSRVDLAIDIPDLEM
jgi:hypothetical protein